MVISDPSHWMEDYKFKGPKYDKVVEIIAALNVTKAYIDKYVSLSSANSIFQVCEVQGFTDISQWTFNQARWVATSTAARIVFQLPLSTTRGDKGLHISSLKMGIVDADANNYIDRWRIIAYTTNSGAISSLIVKDNGTNIITIQDYTDAFTHVDVSSYDYVVIIIDVVTDTNDALEFQPPLLECYYD